MCFLTIMDYIGVLLDPQNDTVITTYSHATTREVVKLSNSNNKDSNRDDDVVIALEAIVTIINPILDDIRTNSSKGNIQTTDANKVVLKEIAYKLRLLKNDIIPLYHPNITSQSKLFN